MKPFRSPLFYLVVVTLSALIVSSMLPVPKEGSPAVLTLIRMEAGKTDTLVIYAEEFFSGSRLKAKAGEEYRIVKITDDRWKDSWVRVSSNGYNWNLPARAMGLRVSDAPCFSLCATYEETDILAFKVADTIRADRDGRISFFANDVPGFYGNNSGRIRVVVTRIR